jgi:hypothetical protein
VIVRRLTPVLRIAGAALLAALGCAAALSAAHLAARGADHVPGPLDRDSAQAAGGDDFVRQSDALARG